MRAALALLLVAAVTTAAPLDRYFGKMKMSALRIRYEVVSIRDRYETHKILPEDAKHLLLLTQDSFYAWAAQYPKDGWLASTAYKFATLYAELPGRDAQANAVHFYTYIKTKFPTTSYAQQSRVALDKGVPVRPDPAWAAERRAAAPSPSPSPIPSGSAAPSASPSAAASAAPTAAPSATPSMKPSGDPRPSH